MIFFVGVDCGVVVGLLFIYFFFGGGRLHLGVCLDFR